jgi:hypothetical protein
MSNTVSTYFNSLNLASLPEKASAYIREQILTDKDFDVLDESNESMFRVMEIIMSKYPDAVNKVEKTVVVAPVVEETVVETPVEQVVETPAPETTVVEVPPAEPVTDTPEASVAEVITKETYQKKIKNYRLLLSMETDKEIKMSIRKKIAAYKVMIEML